jgi:hypothetical protein
MPQTENVPTRTDLEAVLPETLRVIGQSYAFLLWFTHVFPRLHDCAPGYHLVIRNNLMEGTMLNLRKLNEFFKVSPKQRPNDVRATDFPGYTSAGEFLSRSDLEQIHKRFAHLTYHPSSGDWNMADQMETALRASQSFLEYLVRDFYGGDVQRAELAISLRALIVRVLAQIDQLRRAEQNPPPQRQPATRK